MTPQERRHREPSQQELRDAYQALRRPGWPSFEEMMLAARCYQLVRGGAQRLARGERPQGSSANDEPRAGHPSLRVVQRIAGVPLPRHAPQLDHKSLASGERDN
jgi:hypothetical protein